MDLSLYGRNCMKRFEGSKIEFSFGHLKVERAVGQ